MDAPTAWNPSLYLKFEDDRTRPARDLLAQVPLQQPRTVIDLGCGPGNSTELLVQRFPNAQVTGLDSSVDMLQQARKRLPNCAFLEADLATWTPPPQADLLFSNAVFHWVPDHPHVLQRLIEALPQGGVLAVQMPDNTREPSHLLMQEVAKKEPWAHHAALHAPLAEAMRPDLPAPEFYYDLLKPSCSRLDIWHAVYNHVVDGPAAIVEWFKSTALRPFISGMTSELAADYLAAYTAEIARHYPERIDGKALLRFPRLFIVATR
jgi:trans-aconitate 2-methyltransferase